MEIELDREIIEAVGKPRFHEWLTADMSFGGIDIDLRKFSNQSVRRLFDVLSPHDGKVKGVRNALRNIKTWIAAAENGVEKVVCKSAKTFSAMAYEYIQKQDRKWLYCLDDKRKVWRAYYVNNITFREKEVSRFSTTPAHTSIQLLWSEHGFVHEQGERFFDRDVKGRTVVEALLNAGFVVETSDLAAAYKEFDERFGAIHTRIGLQCIATGFGTTDADDEVRPRLLSLDSGDGHSKVVVDVRNEGDDGGSESSDEYNPSFWSRSSLLASSRDENRTNDADDEPEENSVDSGVVIPTFPVVPVFDLARHLRMRVHVSGLTEYKYDKKLARKLVLPEDVSDLIGLLISDTSEFKDIIRNKGAGSVILCAGPAGVGKTLTAEVYAESMCKPLYSVQCSQLGTNEEVLEGELLRVFDRAERWGAILLLDEADVYVRARDTDLHQNAIVGVFLRVLEFYSGVLFMTTNRSDLVDDAITSRCLARIDYAIPSKADQAKIWRILSEGSGLIVNDRVVKAIVDTNPNLSGRDVKQLLKLSAKVLLSRGKNTLDLKTVEFVKRFKPTPSHDHEN